MGIVLGIVIGVVLTLLSSYYLFVLQRKRKCLGYEVLSANLIIPFESKLGNGLQIVVKQELVADSNELTDGTLIPAGKVYGFRVLLHNTGNETIDNQTVLIELDDKAKIVATEIESAPTGMTGITAKRDDQAPNRANCHFPFMNVGQEFIVSILSVKNESTECSVFAPAPGVKANDLAVGYRRLRKIADRLALSGFFIIIMAASIALWIYGWNSRASDILQDSPRGLLLIFVVVLGSVLFAVGAVISTKLTSKKHKERITS